MSYWALTSPDKRQRKSKKQDEEFETDAKAIKRAIEGDDVADTQPAEEAEEDEYEATQHDEDEDDNEDAPEEEDDADFGKKTKKRKRAGKKPKATPSKKRRVSTSTTTTTTKTSAPSVSKFGTTTNSTFNSFQSSNTLIRGSVDDTKWKFVSAIKDRVTPARLKELLDNVWYEPGIIKANSPKPAVYVPLYNRTN